MVPTAAVQTICWKQRNIIVLALCAVGVCFALSTLYDFYLTNVVRQATDAFCRRQKASNDDAYVNISFESESSEEYWRKEYENRLERVRRLCEEDGEAIVGRLWNMASNRRWGKDSTCSARACPIISDEKRKFMFCFIPKVASTQIKTFLLNVFGINANDSVLNDDTALHVFANRHLKRVSPGYYPTTTSRTFFKVMFVRHPFDRLVSAFRNKAEAPREQVRYFYDVYWDKIVQKLRPDSDVSENYNLTFSEFVWYLTHTVSRNYDDHWAPYWNRCDPCLVGYDFIGKLETADHDFPYAFRKVGIDGSSDWWSRGYGSKRNLTLKYFSEISNEDVLHLYKIYRLDFELFGYNLDGFI